MRLFVVGSILGVVFSAIRDPSTFGLPAIVFTLVFLALLWKLWEGERAIWWLFVIATVGSTVAALTAVFDEPIAWAAVAAGAFGSMLLLAGPTRRWVDQR